ncbi:His Kinase A (phospho-acceptor) domain-containing protein [Lishizhenia tianjinensis]|uniref:histidine kinase n=1 Tax=Lishizhenia tianjinensis TaxID=477690 RepID=A0A1I7AW84_9FLAO|nr:ATP-binding protein [Lishizhenia tianjinensis]SFT79155.1 His Kinase A (phospho-acceptor) domain-containing protein [Lishizhenia tianjinensis]
MKQKTAIFFYLLGIYVVLQFLWWGYHLIDLSAQLNIKNGTVDSRVLMILGEGAVFFVILIFGLWKIRASIKKELALSNRQNNFLLSVTHELKTPIAANRLYLQTLLKRSSLSEEKKKEILSSALHENKRLQEMIDNILTATQLDNHALQLNQQEEDLKEIIEKLLYKFIYHRCDVDLQLDVQRKVNIDKMLVEIMLSNLLENAVKYGGGNPITVSVRDLKNAIEIQVKDLGDGIDKTQVNQIFEKFYRIGNEETRTQKGTGLGLYIVSELAKIHKGKVSYEPNQPKGSIFKITLNNV